MSIYPVVVKQMSMKHSGGTKAYHLMVIEAANGNCVFINRWGRVGQFGQFSVVLTDSPVKAMKLWDAKEREKLKNGYSQATPVRALKAEQQSDLVNAIGRGVFNKMGASAVKHIDPGFDTTGMRELDPPEYDENTGVKVDTSRKADIAPLLEETKRIEQEQALRIYEDNPEFGRF